MTDKRHDDKNRRQRQRRRRAGEGAATAEARAPETRSHVPAVLRRYLARSSPGEDAPGKVKPRPSQVPDPLEELYVAGRYEQLVEAVETILRRRRAETPRQAWRYARSCMEIGQPQRLLRTAERFADRSRRHRGFRSQYFQMLVSLDRIAEARRFIRESLFGGSFDLEFLFRAISEYRRLEDNELVATLIDLAQRHGGSSLNFAQGVFLQNIALNIGTPMDALRLSLPTQGDRFESNGHFLLANVSIAERDYPAALVHFNHGLSRFGISPIALRDPAQPFAATNLAAVPGGEARHGPLVTVAMATFNASASVIPALTSLSAQTYRDLEILVVDDCSQDDTAAIVARYAAEVDERVRLVRMDENGGSYRARNRALAEARGAYFTCNDSDDWSHPDKIALLVAALEAGSGIAVNSLLVRLNPEIGLKPKRTGYAHADMSSTLFRREPVVERIGFYDPVRFGADSEYVARLTRAFGDDAIGAIPKVLLVAHWSDATLSAGLGTGISDGGIFYPLRAAYRHAYRSRLDRGEGLRLGLDGTFGEEPAGADLAAASYHRPRAASWRNWKLEESTLFYRDPAIELFWQMPEGFAMPSAALLNLAEALLFKPHGRIVAFEAEERKGPQDGSRVAVAFSGGIDSAAALRLVPDPIPIYTQVARPGGMHRLDNALLAVKEVGGMSIVSNYDELPTMFGSRRGYFGFGGFTITSILLADHLNLRTVADGNIVDSVYLLSAAGHGTLYGRKDHTAELAMFARAGLQYCAPCAGLSEVSTELITRDLKYAMGCMRGEGGNPCGNCMKCYRKGALRGRPIPSCVESERVLSREAIPLLGALLWATKHRGLSHPKLDDMVKDISWVDRWYPESIEFIPPDLRDFFLGRLAHYGIEPVIDATGLETWDSRRTPPEPAAA